MSTKPTSFMFPKLNQGKGKAKGGQWWSNEVAYLCIESCCCRLSVQMEDDEKVLEFRASAGDLLKRESEEVGPRNTYPY